jgi:hypothetical protein
LLTLLGPGGVGKTRLSCGAAAGLAVHFPDGIVFVDLAALRDARLVPASIARALELRESGKGSARALLLEYVSARRVLLVLDHFEHLLEATPLIAELVSRCPRLAALVTSRTALRVQDERGYAVTALATPGTAAPPGEPAVADWPAAQLFVERAKAAAPHFAIQADQASTIASICRRLDGIPLAIELAAARVPLLSPDAQLRRLERPFSALTAGTRHQRRFGLLETVRGHYGEVRAWFRDVLALPGATRPSLLRIRAVGRAGHLAYCRADYPAALAARPATEVDTVRRWLAEGVALEQKTGDRQGPCWSLLALARYAGLDGGVAQAGRLCAGGPAIGAAGWQPPGTGALPGGSRSIGVRRDTRTRRTLGRRGRCASGGTRRVCAAG